MPPPSWDNYTPDPTPEGEASPASRPSQPQRSTAQSTQPVRTSRLGIAIAGGSVVAVLGVVSVVATIGDDDDSATAGRIEPAPVAAQTVEGFKELVGDLEDETGHTIVTDATIYADYASVDVPYAVDDPTDERSLSFYWDGELDEPTKGTDDAGRFDLTQIDPSRFGEMCAAAMALVEDGEGCYLIITAPEPEGDGGWISAYSSNEFNQGGYVEYDLEGNEVYRSDW